MAKQLVDTSFTIRTSFFSFLILLLVGCDSNMEKTESFDPAALSKDPKLLLESSKEKQRIGAYDEAIEILNVAIKIDPKFVDAYNQMGLVFFEADKKNESAEAFKKAIEIDSKNLISFINFSALF